MVQAAAPKAKSKAPWIIAIVALLLLAAVVCFFILLFVILSFAGAQGQPATVIPPSSKGAASGNSVPIPKNLTAQTTDDSVNLSWDNIQTADFKEYKIYRSLLPGKKFSLVKTISESPTYTDSEVFKGVTYYYVVTAVTASGAESGNSSQIFAIIESEPLVPQGIYSWADVKQKIEADSKYLDLLERVTGLTKLDVERLVQKEQNGMDLKRTLLKGTIITNSTKDYKILPNYRLKEDRIALTDENGNPWVLTNCGNPMKLQVLMTPIANVIQSVQVFVTNVITSLPPTVTNIFINVGQSANDVMVAITPSGIRVTLGPTYAPPPPDIFIDPADLGSDYPYPEGMEPGMEEHDHEEPGQESTPSDNLEEGEQWLSEGQLLAIADPHDPAPQQSVNMTIRLVFKKSSVLINYKVKGTDGYTKSGSDNTNSKGEIYFRIPGGKAGVQDTITVNAPSEGYQGSTTYQF